MHQAMEAEDIFAHVEAAIRAAATPVDGMRSVIAFCEAVAPEADWQRIHALPFATDLVHLDKWLTKVLTTEPVSSDINGFWFGLFEPVRDDGTASFDIYICGSDHYDPDEAWHDWAVNPAYWPNGRYANSRVLHEMKLAASLKPELPTQLSDYALSLAYAGLFVSSFARRQAKLLRGNAASRALVVGHDSVIQSLWAW